MSFSFIEPRSQYSGSPFLGGETSKITHSGKLPFLCSEAESRSPSNYQKVVPKSGVLRT
jgi:hypothetical protein